MKAMRIGGKLRRLRQERRLSQAQMAGEIGISPSYLNLIESNQRPVTVTVLLKLAEKFQLDLASLGGESDERLQTDLMEALSDPLFESADVKTSDVRELVAQLPALGRAFVALYQAYRRGGAGDAGLAADPEAAPSALPSEEVTDFLQHRRNHFPELEEAAEQLWLENGLALFTLQQDLVKVLNARFAVDVEIAPAEAMQGLLRLYNPLTRRLQLSELLPLPSRTFQLAHQIAFLGFRKEIDQAVSGGKFTSLEADKLAASALANYFAAAVMSPYDRFLESARATRYDIQTLQHRFGLSFEQVCHRLTTLQRPGAEGVPFHLIRVDIAGNISKRFSLSGIHIARFGAACPRWNVYDAFATPGMLRVQVSRMPDGGAFFCVARTVTPAGRIVMRGGLPQRAGQLAIGLGCPLTHAREIVYADGLNLDDPQIVTPIGVSCRTCPRSDCADRAMPALAQRLVIDENRRGLSTYSAAG
ncbi:MAG: short-chain fatty acyl-CoA regulator family protein [Hyphomicrobiales bacterium]|uniref:helix-turn-helix domain-containing protein n=1 Tax=Rhabdaerophilum calidifontis TaxID=2604328 RepID=UPI00123B300C|nr:short-chain fatty acyl-CoA regulator family protein [Rhabdaerophilum calidifontis]MCA1953277.1 short-chain fatty acyl-CoA regulator family protein [Hyphomicrobiales bacterium]MCA1999623.1 short-chain fatty acyl-CoA regulator family protein [Hyphomicrobiales bacterium]